MRRLLSMTLILLVSLGLLAQTGGVSTPIRSGASLPSGAAINSMFIVNGTGLYKCNVNPCTTAANWTEMAEVDATGKLTVTSIQATTVAVGATNPTIISSAGVTFPDGTVQSTKAVTGSSVAPCNVLTLGVPANGTTDIASTIASAQTACPGGLIFPQGSSTYYVGSAITFAVPVWMQGGAFSGSGALTFNGGLWAAYYKIFNGTNSVAIGSLTSALYPEWWGAVGDGVLFSTTGTNNATAIQAAINAPSITTNYSQYQNNGGASVFFQGRVYNVNGTLTGRGGVNLMGVGKRESFIQNTSASTDTFDLWGTSSVYIEDNRVENIGFARAVPPTGTSAGLSVQYAYGTTVRNTESRDSVRDYYTHAIGAHGTGIFENNQAFHSSGAGYTTGTYYGWYLDSADCVQSPSVRFLHDTYTNALGSSATTYGAYSYGCAMNDWMLDGFETAGASYGQAFVYSGSGSFYSAGDIHNLNSIHDQCGIACLLVSGLVDAQGASLEITGGYFESQVLGSYSIDIENSNNVHVNGGHAYRPVKINGGAGNSVKGLAFVDSAATFAQQIVLTNTSDDLIAENFLVGASGNTATFIAGTGVTWSIFQGNVLRGYSSIGLSLDATSSYNTICGNDINPAHITTPIADSESNPITCGSSGGGGGNVTGAASSTVGNFFSAADTTGKTLADSGKNATSFVAITTGGQPTCASATRGFIWVIEAATGVGAADTFQVCQKNASDVYGWVSH